MGNIVKGKKLMVFVKAGSGDYKSIGFATNHTLSTSASTISVSHKDLYAAGTVLDLKFGVAADSSTGVPTGGWAVPSTGTVLQGKAIVSSVDVNAPVDDNASFSITFTGKGALTVAE